ncbi:hypothetical protein ACWGGS_34070 [Streptomyces decoyicus]
MKQAFPCAGQGRPACLRECHVRLYVRISGVRSGARSRIKCRIPSGGRDSRGHHARWNYPRPRCGRAYVANQGSNTVSVIDAAARTVVENIGVGDGPTPSPPIRRPR